MSDTMASTETRPATAGITSSWRGLGKMGAYQVPIVLGSILAVFGSVVAYVLAVMRRAELVAPSTSGIFLTFLGALGLVGYFVTRDNVKNGCIVAAVAGVGLLLLGGAVGLVAGLVVLVGAIWGLARSL